MSAPKSFALLLVLIGIGLAAGWFMFGMAEEPAPDDFAEYETSDAAGRREAPVDQNSDMPGSEANTAKVETIGSTPFAGESGEANQHAYSILVVDEDDQPIPGAEVEFQDWSGNRLLFSNKKSVALKVLGKTKSRVDGMAFLKQPPRNGLRVTGRAGRLEGRVSIEANALAIGGQEILKLRPLRTVLARVQDAAGAPIMHAPAKMSRHSFMAQSGAGWTDADGLARFDVSPMDSHLYDGKACQVEVVLQSGKYSSAKVPWAEEGPTEVVITVKRRGTLLKIRVQGADGQLDTSEHTVSWQEPRGRSAEFEFLSFPGGLGSAKNLSRSRTFSGGEIAFAGFRPGAKVKLTLESKGRVEVTQGVELPNPGVELHEVIMTIGAPAPVVIIPFVNENGEPLSGKKFAIHTKAKAKSNLNVNSPFSSQGPHGPGETMTVDSSGHITFELKVNASSVVEVREVLTSVFWGASGDILASTEVPPLAPGERHTLEPVTIPDAPLLASGQVTDVDGEPQSGVLVRVLKFPTSGDSNAWAVNNRLQSVRMRTGPDGKFQLYSRVKGDGLYLLALKSPQEKSIALPFAAGDRDLKLEVQASGGIAIAVNRAITEKNLNIRCSLEAIARDGSIGYFARDLQKSKNLKVDQSTHEITSLVPGTYEVTFEVGGVKVRTVNQVVVKSGAVTRDPRLLGITPDEGYMLGKVTVRDDSGEPVKGVTVKFKLPTEHGSGSSSRRVEAKSDEHGVAARVCRIGTVCNLKVRSKGYLPFEKNEVHLPAEITLSRGATFKVVVDPEGSFPESEHIKAWMLSLRAKPKKKTELSAANKAQLEALLEAARKGDHREVSTAINLSSVGSFGYSRGRTAGVSHKLSPNGEATISGIAPGDYEVFLRADERHRVATNWNASVILDIRGSRSGTRGIKLGEVSFPEGGPDIQTGRYSITQKWLLEQVAIAEKGDDK